MSAAEGSEARRAILGFLLGVALGALVGLLARRGSSAGESGAGESRWPGGSAS